MRTGQWKYHRLYYKNKEIFKNYEFGFFGIKTSKLCVLNQKHIEALIKVLKFCKRKSESYFRFRLYIFATFWQTIKPKGLRMGRGKGAVANKIILLKAGTVVLKILTTHVSWVVKTVEALKVKLPGNCTYIRFSKW